MERSGKRDQPPQRRPAYRRDRPNSKLRYEGAVLISIPESTRITGLGTSLTYKMVRDGTLPAAQLNGRWYVHRPKLLEWLERFSGDKNAA